VDTRLIAKAEKIALKVHGNQQPIK